MLDSYIIQLNLILLYPLQLLQPQIMISSKIIQKIQTTRSNKKLGRVLHTEPDEPYRKSILSNKVTHKQPSKQKYLDVYSKIIVKQPSNNPRKNIKLVSQKTQVRHLRTEPSQIDKRVSSQTQTTVQNLQKYEIDGVAGKGTFGTVYFGHVRGTGEKVAIKKVLQDKRYKNRQLQILKQLKNQCVVEMRDFFLNYQGDKQFLNVVMNYFPYNLYQAIKKKQLNNYTNKIIMFQILKGLNYLSTLSIAHRDIKPQNILVDLTKNRALICDFGSAKKLVAGQSNLAYICSRCYRAPELIFEATDYTEQIDMWSTGCVFIQMINGVPPFLGQSQIDQLIEIIKVLGTPSKTDVRQMNQEYDMKQYAKFPAVKATQWRHLLHTKDMILVDLITKIMRYSPKKRLTAAQAIMHPYFDDLRDEQTYQQILIKCKKIPPLFNFSKQQLKNFADPKLCVPPWTKTQSIQINSSMIKKPIKKLA